MRPFVITGCLHVFGVADIEAARGFADVGLVAFSAVILVYAF